VVMETLKIEVPVNVFDEPLISCCENPMTGFFRDGCCNTNQQDFGSHTVCIEVTKAFLEYSRDRGVDLLTPNSDFDFPGLRAGDKWCMCALSWLETHDQHKAPRVFLRCTHKRAIDIIPMRLLKQYAVDLN